MSKTETSHNKWRTGKVCGKSREILLVPHLSLKKTLIQLKMTLGSWALSAKYCRKNGTNEDSTFV